MYDLRHVFLVMEDGGWRSGGWTKVQIIESKTCRCGWFVLEILGIGI